MFEFLTQKRDGTLVDLLSVVSVDLTKLQAARWAHERAVDLIAKSVARCEILKQTSDGITTDDDYYVLNIQPNSNENGYAFWYQVTKRLLKEQECLIVPLNGSLYIADSYSVTQEAMKPRRYSSITLEVAGQTKAIYRTFKADEVIHIRYSNERIREYTKQLLGQYDSVIDTVQSYYKTAHSSKFISRINAPGSIPGQSVKLIDRETGKVLTKEDYAQKLAADLAADKLSVITMNDGRDIEQLKIDSGGVTADQLQKLIESAEHAAAMAYDIPLNVFSGTITEKGQSDANFCTYALMPVIDAIDSELNAKMVGHDDYLKGERLITWTGNFSQKNLADSAAGLEKLRGIGFSLDECRQAVGWTQLGTDFSTKRALTKNFTTEEDT